MPENLAGVAESEMGSHTVPSLDPNLQTDTVAIQVKLCNLPPFHGIANQVLSLSADPDVDLRRLASVMEADPAFAAEVLFLANSSLFGFSSQMRVLRHAVAILGLDRIKALAVTVAMRAFLGMSGPMIRPCWRHSAATAIIAEQIASVFEISGERAYTVCLMHDVGRLGLIKSYTLDLARVLGAEYRDPEDLLLAEREAVCADHATAGSWLVKYWELPAEFGEICAAHHDPICLQDSPLLQTAKMACRVADVLGFAPVRYCSSAPFEQVVRLLPPHQQRKFPSEDELRKKIAERIQAFEG